MSKLSIIRRVRSKIYRNSDLLQYIWLQRNWRKCRQDMAKISDEEFAKEYYRFYAGKTLNLEDPQSFSEKLWYLKLNYRNPLITICSDKYRVREYVEGCGLGHILNGCYGAYDNAKDIDFDSLPSPCFLKCNHTSGINLIYDKTKPFSRRAFIRKFNFMLKQNYYWAGREWNYKNIAPKIVAEPVLRDEDGDFPMDRKFMCFGGKPRLLRLMSQVCDEKGEHNRGERYVNIYDMDFNLQDVTIGCPNYPDDNIQKPPHFEEMKKYAEILSAPFPCCRVDFMICGEKLYFGEITFYDGPVCSNSIEPSEWNLRMGSWLDVTDVKLEQ